MTEFQLWSKDKTGLKKLEQLTELWIKQIAVIDSDFCEKDDNHVLLEKLFPQEEGLTEGIFGGEDRSE